MRTKNSIRNTIAALASNIVAIFVGLIAQSVFIKTLGAEYLGINGLFTNIISMLGIVELGIGSAIIYNLYKPIVNKDYDTINSLMNFYKKAYNIIAIIVLLIGISITPFLGYFTGKVTIAVNIELIYILFIIDIVFSYIFSYKRSLLYADQKNYIVNIVHMIYLILLNTTQLIALYITKNYYLYLVVKIIFRILENIFITIIVNKKYKYLKEKNIQKLDKKIEKDIFKKIKALFFHKIAAFVVLGTDNIVISRFLGVISVGLYSNYYLIINAINVLFGQVMTSLTPSIGNMIVKDSKEKAFDIFKKIRFLNFWLCTFTSTALLLMMSDFIKIWIGKEYLLPIYVLLVLVINYFQKMMRYSYSIFKEAAGIYYEDRYVPIIEATTNIVASVILVKNFGLAGVFIGTIISSLIIWCYSYPKFVYKKLFDRKYKSYIKETILYLFLFITIISVSYFISSIVNFNNNFISLIFNTIISILIPNIIIIMIFKNNNNFKYCINLIKRK